MELASEGTLQQFLQRHSPGYQQVMIGRGEKPSVSMTKKQALTSQKLLALAAQVASGLDHLEKFKVEHSGNLHFIIYYLEENLYLSLYTTEFL